ncbi:unnamed protein product, partial [Tuber aestivum]
LHDGRQFTDKLSVHAVWYLQKYHLTADKPIIAILQAARAGGVFFSLFVWVTLGWNRQTANLIFFPRNKSNPHTATGAAQLNLLYREILYRLLEYSFPHILVRVSDGEYNGLDRLCTSTVPYNTREIRIWGFSKFD